jgi:hypothetical protein
LIICAISSMSIGILFSCFVKNTSNAGIISTLLLIPSLLDVSVFPSGIKTILDFLPSHLAQSALNGQLLRATMVMCLEAIICLLTSQLYYRYFIKKT